MSDQRSYFPDVLPRQVASGLRWFFLAALPLVSGYAGVLSRELVFLLAGWALFAILATLYRGVLWRSRWGSWASVVVDLAFASAAVTISGGFASPLWWGLLVGAAAAGIANGTMAALLVAIVSILANSGLSLLFAADSVGMAPLAAVQAVVVLTVSFLVGWFAQRGRNRVWTMVRSYELAFSSPWQQALERMSALLGMAAKVSGSFDPREVFELALDMGARVLESSPSEDRRLVSALLLRKNGQARVVSARGFDPSDWEAALRSDRGVIGEALKTGGVTVSANPGGDAVLRKLETLKACRKAVCVPLDAGPETKGLLLFAHPRPEYFRAENLELLAEIARQVGIGLQNANLYRRLEQEKDRITELQEEARRKMARDLHDGPTQAIAAIAMRLNYARRMMARNPEQASEELRKVEEMARTTTREIRHMLFTLRPLILESQGLVAALFQLAGKMRETHGNDVIIEAEADAADKLEMATQSVLFFIAEEAINNARKHAEAEHIRVRLKSQDEQFVLEVEDDGVGFNVGAVDANYAQRGSLGIVNMRERTELVNGIFHLQSSEGEGTLITVCVPLNHGGAQS